MQVHPGDSLWRIGQKLYGDGMRFLDIYRANARRIFNPERIYPGQVFVMPGRTN
ncbi:MAG: LysM peptidoglycan-binding domain-containing protein [Methylobacteriaceae bacterium]|nr:LysM peptidoglycan-binding domain-containing protein [Methylobacteriaceae bacterium]